MTCPAVGRWGDHLYVLTYTRRLRDLFRARKVLRCWQCDIKVLDPDVNWRVPPGM